MKKLCFIFTVLCLGIFLLADTGYIQAGETLTVTTYYPSPYGNYKELASHRMKIGTTYSGTGTSVSDNNLIVENSVGIGVTNPAYILQVLQGSATDPIADSWGVYSCDRAHKDVVNVIETYGYLDAMRNQPLYLWKRKADHPDKYKRPKFAYKHLGMMIDDPQTPEEILLRDDQGNVAGIDLLAYIGYLHVAIKEAAIEIHALKSEIKNPKK